MSCKENDKIEDNMRDSFESMRASLDSIIFHTQAIQILLDPTISIKESNKRIEDLKIKLAITDD